MLNLNSFHLQENCEEFSIKINVYYILQWAEDEIRKKSWDFYKSNVLHWLIS